MTTAQQTRETDRQEGDRTPAQSGTLVQLTCEGFIATADATVADLGDKSALLFVSMLGTQAAARAITANIMVNPLKNLYLQELDPESDHGLPQGNIITLQRASTAPWRRRHRQLPLSRAWHTILWDRRIEPDFPTKDFILVNTKNEHQAAAQHLVYLQRRLKIPFHSSWAEWAWTRALETDEAVPLAATNVFAWHCLPNPDSIRGDITEAIKTGLLTT